jgi:hypothetical protein
LWNAIWLEPNWQSSMRCIFANIVCIMTQNNFIRLIQMV